MKSVCFYTGVIFIYFIRGVVRRQEMLQCKVEKSENLLFNKAEEKDNLQKRVCTVYMYMQCIHVYRIHTFLDRLSCFLPIPIPTPHPIPLETCHICLVEGH